MAGIDCFTSSYDVATKVGTWRPFVRLGNSPSPRPIFVPTGVGDRRAEVEAVFHQAALAGVRASWDARVAEYGTHNILATQRLLEAARNSAGVRRCIYASSSSVYGNALGSGTDAQHSESPLWSSTLAELWPKASLSASTA